MLNTVVCLDSFVMPMWEIKNVLQGWRKTSKCKKEKPLISLTTFHPSCTTEGKKLQENARYIFFFILQFSFKTPAIHSCFSSYFSANGQPTIIPRNDTNNMGQRVMMTKTDIEKVRRLYRCGTCFFLWVKITGTQLSTFNFNLKSDHVTLETQTGKAACGRTVIDAFGLSAWLIADQIRFGPLSYVIFFFFLNQIQIWFILFYFISLKGDLSLKTHVLQC